MDVMTEDTRSAGVRREDTQDRVRGWRRRGALIHLIKLTPYLCTVSLCVYGPIPAFVTYLCCVHAVKGLIAQTEQGQPAVLRDKKLQMRLN